MSFTIDRAPPTLTIESAHPSNGQGEVHGPFVGTANSPTDWLWLHNRVMAAPAAGIDFNATDAGAGLASLEVSGLAGSTEAFDPSKRILRWTAAPGSAPEFSKLKTEVLPDATGYGAAASDALGKATAVFFHVDSLAPDADYSLSVANPSLAVTASGTARDALSGVAEVVVIPQLAGEPTVSTGLAPGATVLPFAVPVPELTGDGAGWRLAAVDASGLADSLNPIHFTVAEHRGAFNDFPAGQGWKLWGDLEPRSPLAGSMATLLRAARLSVGCVSRATGSSCSSASPPAECAAALGQACGRAVLKTRSTSGPAIGVPVAWVNQAAAERTVVEQDVVAGAAVDGARVVVNLGLGAGQGAQTEFRLDVEDLGLAGVRPVGFGFYHDADFMTGGGQQSPLVAPLDLGLNVTADLPGLVVTISRVTPGGQNLLAAADMAVSPPEGLSLAPGTVGAKDLLLLASFEGPLRVRLFHGGDLTPEQKAGIDIYHLEEGGWRKVTAARDPGGNWVEGETSHASLFALFIPTPLLPPPGGGGAEGLAIASAPGGRLWMVVREGGSVKLARFDAGGTRERETSLAGALEEGNWTIRPDPGGGVLVAGTGSGEVAGQGTVVVYRADGEGTLVSSAAVRSGLDGRSAALDAAGDVWISGAVESGAGGATRLGLWRYCPHQGTIALRAGYERGGGYDAGYGVRVVGEDVWVAGFSKHPSPPPGAPPFDLALWRFDGQGSLAGGPFFKPWRMDPEAESEADFGLRLESSGGRLFVAAPRFDDPGRKTDLGLAVFDAAGSLAVERSWSSAENGSDIPAGMAVDGEGTVTVAGGVEAEGRPPRLGIWRYAPDGSFIEAETIAGVGFGNGISLTPAATWLAVEGRASPVRLEGAVELAGADVLISSRPAGDAAPPVTAAAVGEPRFEAADGTLYVSPRTPITFTAEDPGPGASGVERIEVAVDTAAFSTFVATLTLAEGSHQVLYRAVDRAGNAEAARVLALKSDGTAPETVLSLGEPRLGFFGVAAATPETPITLAAADPERQGVSAGAARTSYRVDGGAELEFTAAFTLAEGTHVVEFWSEDRVGNMEAAKTSTMAAARLELSVLAGARGASLSGNPLVHGRVESGGAIELSGNALIEGDAAGSIVKTTGKARVAGTIADGFSLHPEPIDMALLAARAEALKTNGRIPAGFLSGGRLVVDGGRTLSLPEGFYVVDGLEVRGQGKIELLGPVGILVKGAVTVEGSGSVNAGGEVKRLAVAILGSEAARLGGEASWSGVLYAPGAALDISGNAKAIGHLFGRVARVTGGARIGDMAAALALGPGGGSGPGKKTLELAAQQSFGLSCQAAYPNPARRGAGVVIRVCAGPSDGMEVEVKDMLGRVVHRGSTGPARVVDRNGAPTYVNDYSWAAALRPGVYAYAFAVRKAGYAALRGSGRLGVTP